MATAAITTQSAGVVNVATGSFTGDATVTTITLGFKPRSVKIFNHTDVIVWEKLEGMAAASCFKTVAAGTTTFDATSQVLISDAGVVTLTAALAASAKLISWIAIG